VGLSLLIGNGIGPARSQSILEKFDLTLEPKQPETYLTDCNGIGPKLAAVVQESLNLPLEITTRPKVRKARRGRQRSDGFFR
jgi:ribosomal protein S13